eukprot:TRINITY_DN10861_c0_g2_i1.p1 TRINITY_DN10861_c0_g2~~TRINITY_DN10861_c0_g2_i1.p1  ORF type:complete len:311 (+),score=83.51 TRINITY_DN10861_c0_g2_i1:57-935(+)
MVPALERVVDAGRPPDPRPAPDAGPRVVVTVVDGPPGIDRPRRNKCRSRAVFAACAALLGALALWRFGLPQHDFAELREHGVAGLRQHGVAELDKLESLLKEAGAAGPVYVACLYLVTTVCMLPLMGFHVTCGYVYGTGKATALISVSQTVAAAAAMLVARYFVRSKVRNHLSRRYGRSFVAIDRAVAKDGFRVTALMRLAPIVPFGINNYLLGCTDVTMPDFMAGTWLGVLPGTFLYCNLGAIGRSARMSYGSEWAPQQVAAAVLGVAGVAIAVPLLARLALRALRSSHDV